MPAQELSLRQELEQYFRQQPDAWTNIKQLQTLPEFKYYDASTVRKFLRELVDIRVLQLQIKNKASGYRYRLRQVNPLKITTQQFEQDLEKELAKQEKAEAQLTALLEEEEPLSLDEVDSQAAKEWQRMIKQKVGNPNPNNLISHPEPKPMASAQFQAACQEDFFRLDLSLMNNQSL